MQVKTVDISVIKPYQGNAKAHPDDQVAQIARSLKEFGFNQPIVVDADGVIIAGHGRYLAAQQLGLKTVPVVYAAHLNAQQIEAYRLADNKLNESKWDMDLVLEQLGTLEGMGYDVTLTGFDLDLLKGVEPQVLDDISLPDGEKSEYQQITFTLHNEQAFVVKEALKAATLSGLILDTDNENGNGNAIYTIAKQWLQQKTSSSNA